VLFVYLIVIIRFSYYLFFLVLSSDLSLIGIVFVLLVDSAIFSHTRL